MSRPSMSKLPMSKSPLPRIRPHWPWLLTTLTLLLAAPTAQVQTAALSLEQALQSLRELPEWRSSELTEQAAQRNLVQSQANTGLALSASTAYSSLSATSGDAKASSSLNLNLTASATVLPWSAAFDAVRSASRSQVQTARSQFDARTTLTINRIAAYYEARNASLDTGLAQATLKLRQEQLRVAIERSQNGQLALTDLLSAQNDLVSAQAALLSAQNAQTLDLLTLGAAAQTVLTTAPQTLDLPGSTLDGLSQTALVLRTDVQNAALQVTDAEDALSVARRGRWLPDASISVGYGQVAGGQVVGPSVVGSLNVSSGVASLTGSYPAGGASSTSTGLSLSLSAVLPILAPGDDARVATAQTALDQARTNRASVQRSALLDITQRFGDAATAQATVDVRQASLQTARQTLATAQARQDAGLNTVLDVQSAGVSVQGAERDLQRAIASQAVAVLRLKSALGQPVSVAVAP